MHESKSQMVRPLISVESFFLFAILHLGGYYALRQCLTEGDMGCCGVANFFMLCCGE